MKSPIIIIGMHRSGTSLITRLLGEVGVFFGNDLEENYESMFFQIINEWILRRIGGSWAYPQDIKYLLENSSLTEKLVKILEEELSSYRFYQYLGLKNLINKKRILTGLWGWKDPRNSFTLPVWMKLFNMAKVIYIKRNGIDIAASLVKRQEMYIKSTNSNPFINFTLIQKVKNLFSPIEIPHFNALKCVDMEESYRLWELYTQNCEEIYNQLSAKKISFRYEDLLTNPSEILKELFSFLDISQNHSSIENLKNKINTKRKFAFLKDPELIEFYRLHQNDKFMKMLNYDNLI